MNDVESKGLIDMSTVHGLIKEEVIEEPLSSRGEMETDRQTLLDRLKFEEFEDEQDIKRTVLEDVDDVDGKGLIDMSTLHSLVKVELIEEPLSSQSGGEMETDRQTLLDCSKFEEFEDNRNIKRTVLEDVDDVDSKGLMDMSTVHSLIKEEVIEEPLSSRGEMETDNQTLLDRLKFEEFEDEQDIKRTVLEDVDDVDSKELIDMSTAHGLIKEEVIEDPLSSRGEMETDKQTLLDHLKFEESDDEQDIKRTVLEDVDDVDSKGLIDMSTLHGLVKVEIIEEPLSSQSREEMETDRQTQLDCLKFEESEDEGDIDRAVPEDMDDTDSETLKSGTSGEESSHQRTVLRKQTCSRTGVVNKHTETHSGNKIFECGICQRTYANKATLDRHLRTHTSEKSFECEICQVKFNRKYHLTTHLRTHTGEKPFECEICHAKFNCKPYLNAHHKTHTGEKPFECKICQNKFSQSFSLKRHQRIHTGEIPFKCEICQMKFKQSSSLKRHLITHTGEKPFECQICHVKFKQKFDLKGHLRIHTGEKPYKCEICQQSFRWRKSLNIHFKSHTRVRPV